MGDKNLTDRAFPRLTSRDPQKFWTSGQWMTERRGGSDVGVYLLYLQITSLALTDTQLLTVLNYFGYWQISFSL